MIRAPIGDQAYWDKWKSFRLYAINKTEDEFIHPEPDDDPVCIPQIMLNNMHRRLRYILTLYSCGDPISTLGQYLPGVLSDWELSNRLAEDICREYQVKSCRDWVFDLADLEYYNFCFWLIGLALVLDTPEDQWQRLLTLIGEEGKDVLLDRVIASRQPERKIGATLLHKKPYARLLKAIDAPQEQQAALLKDFVDHWYAGLARRGDKELWWYVYGDPVKHPLEKGSYFGRWCVEAVAAVKAFGLDDTLCLGHEHYPGDLLRPDGPSTHPPRPQDIPPPSPFAFLKRWFGKEQA